MKQEAYIHQESIQALLLHLDYALGVWDPKMYCPYCLQFADRASYLVCSPGGGVNPPSGMHISDPRCG